MKRIIPGLGCRFMSLTMAAQKNYSSVYMNDGSVVEGEIVYKNSEKMVVKKGLDDRILMVGNVEKILPWEEAESVAPKNSLTFKLNNALSLSHRFSLSYERRVIDRKNSFGVDVTAALPASWMQGLSQPYVGAEIAPMYRYYIYGEANSYGFYIQAKAVLGAYWLIHDNIHIPFESNITSYDVLDGSFFCYGGILSFGYLFRLGDHLGFDLNLGYKAMSGDKSMVRVNFYDQESVTGPLDRFSSRWKWFRGPACPVEMRIGLSYRF